MNVPPEFREFSRKFHQDAFIVHRRLEDAIAAALKAFDDRERRALQSLLLDLIGSDMSDSSLSTLWAGSGSDFYIRGPRSFFGEVLKQLH